MKEKKRSRIVLVAVLTVALVTATPTRAQTGEVPVKDTQHIVHTIIHYIGRLYEIYQKYVQIQNQYYQIRNQLQMLKKLDRYWARNIVYTMEFMEDLMARYELPSHMDPQVHQLHPFLYPGWTPPVDYWRERRESATQTLATMQHSLSAQHVAFKTARAMLANGFEPDVISSDVHKLCIDGPAFAAYEAFLADALRDLGLKVEARLEGGVYELRMTFPTAITLALLLGVPRAR